MSKITHHSAAILRSDQEIEVNLTIEWSLDHQFISHGRITWWCDSIICKDKDGREFELTPWERESFAHQYVRDLY